MEKSFKEKVIEIVRKIPKGKVLTYKQVAYLAGNEKAARAVGRILATHKIKDLPCHRVIKSDGTLGGYQWGKEKKRKLLIKEGVKINSIFFLLDRITKEIFLRYNIEIKNFFIQLKLVKNQNLFFLEISREAILSISFFSFILLFYLFWKSYKSKRKYLLALLFISFGGISNLIDRIFYGFVIDWIKLKIWPFSIFNIADLMIIFGIICFLILELKKLKF